MPYPIHEKFVIAVSSSALFDLSESNQVFIEKGAQAYKEFQKSKLNETLKKGVAFPFIRRFLNINKRFPDEQPVEVVLLSRNSVVTGLRVFNSIEHYQLDITRAAFTEGNSPYRYIPAFNACLFLTADENDVKKAIDINLPAGTVLPSTVYDDETDDELRVGLDFDCVIADDEAEEVYKRVSLEGFHSHEEKNSHIPHKPGPLADFFKKLALIQKLEERKEAKEKGYKRIIRTAIVTARNAPSHGRVITTLESWGVGVNETFFLGGIEKKLVLTLLKPHIYFDDQKSHLDSEAANIPMVHIPFGIANK